MKIKIVVRVSMNDEKSRSKALKISVGISGVESAALSGATKDQVVVVGESIDAVELTRQLRKGLCHAELVSVGEDKKEDKPAAKMEAPVPAVPWSHVYPPPYAGYNSYPIYEKLGPFPFPLFRAWAFACLFPIGQLRSEKYPSSSTSDSSGLLELDDPSVPFCFL